MAIRVVTDYRDGRARRRAAGGFRLATGTVLLVVGMTTIPFLVIWTDTHRASPSTDVSHRTADGLVALVLLVTVASTLVGARLIRGRRRMVLFLRRFGFSAATAAMTAAVSGAVGRTWRVVTLDDAAIAPVGVTPGTRRVFHGVRLAVSALIWPLRLVYAAVIVTFWTAAVWIGVLIETTKHAHRSVSALFSDAVSSGPVSGDAHTLRILLIAAVAACATPAVVGLFGLGGYLMLGTSLPVAAAAARSVREAEAANRATILVPADLRTVPPLIVRRTRKVFGPRLVVVRVATELWQQAVARFASRASLVVIDVSRPTGNLLWELENTLPRLGPRCVLIGVRDEVCRLADAGYVFAAGPAHERLAALLDGREVLGYTADEPGVRRFAHALAITLDAAAAA